VKRRAALLALNLLTACAPTTAQPPPPLTVEASYGDGLVYFKVTNTSGGPLLYWNDLCMLRVKVTLPDGSPAPLPAPGQYCGLTAPLEPKMLPAADFLIERREWLLPPGTYALRVSVDLTFAHDSRSEEQRRLYRTPPPDSGCRGIPCPPKYGYGLDPGDPFNPRNMPMKKVTLEAPPLIVTVP